MNVRTTHTFELTFDCLSDVDFAIAACLGAAQGWAGCSNESTPLLDLAAGLSEQLPADYIPTRAPNLRLRGHAQSEGLPTALLYPNEPI